MNATTTKSENAIERACGWANDRRAAVAATIMTSVVLPAISATPAWAAEGKTDAPALLGNMRDLLSGGISMIGAIMVIFGAVSIGVNVHNGAQGNGSAIATGVATLIGGVIIAAAGVYFGSLDITWSQQNQ